MADDIEDVKEGPDREAAVSRGGLFQDGHGEAEEGETGVGTAWGADHGAFPAWAGAVSAPDVPVEAHLQAPTEAPCSSLGAVAGLEAAVAGAEAAAAVAGFKAAAHVRDLQLLAFTETQAVAAVRLFGSDLQAAVEWLLEVRIRGLGDPTALLLVAAGREAAEVDVSEEMAVMERAVHMGVPRGRVHEAVLAADGDVHAAVDSLLLDTPPLGGLAGEGWEADAGLGPGFDLGLGSGGSDLGAPLLRDVSCALECDLERLVGSLLVG